MHRHPLDGSFAKIERARENLHTLNQSTEAFLQPNPYAVAIDEDPKTGWNVVILRAERVPLRLSAIAGDVLHDLRSALDHLIWELVRAEGNTPGRHNQFPIYTDEGNFLADITNRSPKRSPGPLEGIDPQGPAWALIEREQPYHRRHPERTVLDFVHSFSNIDKHRTLLPGYSFLRTIDIEGFLTWNPDAVLLEKHIELSVSQPIESSTELARLRFDTGGPDPEVDVNPGLVLEVTFGDGDRQAPLEAFARARVGVIALLDKFEQFF